MTSLILAQLLVFVRPTVTPPVVNHEVWRPGSSHGAMHTGIPQTVAFVAGSQRAIGYSTIITEGPRQNATVYVEVGRLRRQHVSRNHASAY